MKIMPIARLLFFLCYFPLLLGQYSYPFPKPTERDRSLQKNNPYLDHLPPFAVLFSKMPKARLLEFGLGEGTEYLLQSCRKVTSVELVTPANDQTWFQKCVGDYHAYAHWRPILKVGSHALERSDAMATQEVDPSLYDGSYLLELKDLCDSLFAEESYDIVFVDPGIHLRGDLVNELFGRADVIVAHDTAYSDRIYGWVKIATPFDYIRLDYKEGCGTTFWIHKSQKDLIEKLLPNYVEQQPRKLRIFFPEIHGELTKSMILLCQHLGHTLVLPGASFLPSDVRSGPKLCYGVFPNNLEDWPVEGRSNVEIIENDEIFKNPPDVFFINCKEVEEDVLNITQVNIAHYSGNNNVPYASEHLKNLISADATTVYQYDLNKIYCAFWIPWIDWPSLEYMGPSLQGTIDSYLSVHYLQEGFFPAKDLYESYTSQYEKIQHFSPFVLHDWIRGKERFVTMEKSMGTLHVKNSEGFGYTVIESLAKGRPVFLKRSFSEGQKLMNWCISDQTALFFDDFSQFAHSINRYLYDETYRVNLQNNAARQIRRMIHNERQALIFENFIQNLK